MQKQEEEYLPADILRKSKRLDKEFGWAYDDFHDVVIAAKNSKLGIIGGQIQFILPDVACELYWLSYDTEPRKIGENWKDYCERTANECLYKFNKLGTKDNIISDAIKSFSFLKEKANQGVDLSMFLFCILYFNDLETFLEEI